MAVKAAKAEGKHRECVKGKIKPLHTLCKLTNFAVNDSDVRNVQEKSMNSI